MSLLKKLGGSDNTLNLYLINGIVLLLIGVINLIRGILDFRSFVYFLEFVVPFFVALGINILSWKKGFFKWHAVLYGIIGIWVILSNEPSNFSAVVFILFSFHIFNNKVSNVVLFCGVVIAVFIRNVLVDSEPGFLVAHYLVFGYVFVIYFLLFQKNTISFSKEIDDITRQLITLKTKGYTTKEIADRMCLSTDAISKRLKRLCVKFGCKNNDVLLYTLLRDGHIVP